MLISLGWIHEILALGGLETSLEAPEAAALITSLGLEVEGTTAHGRGLGDVVVAEVRGVRPHPSVDPRAGKLRLVEVFDGHGLREVVCGAPNVPAPGGLVVLAPVGTRLPDGLVLTEREIRGVRSSGMLCSEKELDLGPDDAGILVLPAGFRAGQRLADALPGTRDDVFELSVTPNRPDALGHVGVARDLAAKLGRRLELPPPTAAPWNDAAELVSLRAPERCGRYLAVALDGARIGAAPPWMRLRLHRLGLRPINAAVDVTNLVLLEWGQPLHCFDRGSLAEGRVVVRHAARGERMRTLDGRDLTLDADDLVIADARVPQALAGVMGGEHSGVGDATRSLLLEVAWFDPPGVRRSARRHGIASDSSHRFERGVDHGFGLDGAAERALRLLADTTGAVAVRYEAALGRRPAVPSIRYRPQRARRILGLDVGSAESGLALAHLGVELDRSDPDAWIARPPTHRPDLQREEDLVEEVMRIHGLDDLPATPALPTAPPSPLPSHQGRNVIALLRDTAADVLVGAGFHECVSFVFRDERELAPFGDEVPAERWVRLENPMRAQSPCLRSHLLPGLLETAALNRARHAGALALFESGRVYMWPAARSPAGVGPTASADAALAVEPERVAFLLCGPRGEGPTTALPRRALTVLLALLRRCGVDAELAPAVPPVSWLHPGVQVQLVAEGPGDGRRTHVARCGEIHPDLLAAGELAGSGAVYAEVYLDRLRPCAVRRHEPVPRHPCTARDLSLELPSEIPASVAIDALRAAAHSLAEAHAAYLGPGDAGEPAVVGVSEWRGEGLAPGARSVLLRLHYRAIERSVTDAEADALHEAVVTGALEHLRGSMLAGDAVRRR